MVAIYTQNRQAIWNYTDISRFHVTGNGTGIQVVAKNGAGLVNVEYGINVGGRCCRDYNVGYSEDKRVFVSEQNYCGRARRRRDE